MMLRSQSKNGSVLVVPNWRHVATLGPSAGWGFPDHPPRLAVAVESRRRSGVVPVGLKLF